MYIVFLDVIELRHSVLCDTFHVVSSLNQLVSEETVFYAEFEFFLFLSSLQSHKSIYELLNFCVNFISLECGKLKVEHMSDHLVIQ